MPIYEYRCDDCDRETSVFLRSVRSASNPSCEHCGSAALTRLISRVARLRTDQDVLDQYSRPEDGYRDPRQIGRWVEDRFQEYGMELPSETRDMIDAARDGELPDPIKDL